MATIEELEHAQKSIADQLKRAKSAERKAARARVKAGEALDKWLSKHQTVLTLEESGDIVVLIGKMIPAAEPKEPSNG